MQLDMIGLDRMGASMVRQSSNRRSETLCRCWTRDVPSLIAEGVPAPVLSAALLQRFRSRGNADFANRIPSALRYELGAHVEKPAP